VRRRCRGRHKRWAPICGCSCVKNGSRRRSVPKMRGARRS